MTYVVDTEKTKDEYAWIRYIKKRIYRDNKNFLAYAEGQTGSGKTYSMLSICKLVDPDFNIDRVVFSAKELMELLNSDTLKKGSAILFDEAQIELGARTWQSTINKILNYLLSTFRHRNLVLLMTAPYSDFIDSQTRRLFHARFKTMKIDKKNQTCSVKAHLLQYNPEMKKTYNHRMSVKKRIANKNKYALVQLDYWDIPKPPEELIELYEQKKLRFTTNLNKDIMKKLQPEEKPDVRRPLTERQAQILGLLKKYKDNKEEVAKALNISLVAVYQNLKFAKKKGYTIDNLHLMKD